MVLQTTNAVWSPMRYNQYEPFSYTAIFLMTMVFLGVVLFMARTFKWAKDAYDSFEHSYGVMAMTDSLVDGLSKIGLQMFK